MQKKIVALGFFDGVHSGHGALLSRAKKLAVLKNSISAALLFDRHPSSVVGKNPVPLLNTMEERALLMTHLYGIDEMLPLEFNELCASLPWERFAKEILIDKFDATHLVAGYDFRFGHRGEGNGDKLKALCNSLNIGCDIVERVEINGKTVSSSLIRELITAGDVKTAAEFLGHNHFIYSPVLHGAALGRSIGIPTINQHFEKDICVPRFGVYVTNVHIGGKIFRGVTNVGIRPSVENDNIPRAETHIIDFHDDLYGEKIGVEFIDMLRDEKRFDSLNELKNAIKSDIEKAIS